MRPFSEMLNCLGIDLGSSYVHIYYRRKPVLAEDSVAAVEHTGGQLLGFGTNALILYHKDPENVRLVRPIRHGAIANYEATKSLLRFFINKAIHHSVSKPNIVVSVPSGISSVTRHALADALMHAGAQRVFLLPAPAAAAIGSNKDLTIPSVLFSLIIGKDVSDAGIYSCGGIVAQKHIAWGGRDIDLGICQYIKKKYNVVIVPDAAEKIKKEKVSYQSTSEGSFTVRGRRISDGVEVIIELTFQEMSLLVQRLSQPLVELIRYVLQKVSPEMAGDLLTNGILLSGGGAGFQGIRDWLSFVSGMPVFIADDLENVIAKGCFQSFENRDALSLILEDGGKYYGGIKF